MAQIEMILQNTYDQQLNNFSDMIKHFYLSSGFNFLGTMEARESNQHHSTSLPEHAFGKNT